MATVSLSIKGVVDGKDQEITLSGDTPVEMEPYFWACYRDAYDRSEPLLDEKGEPRARTDAEVFAAVARGFRLGTMAAVKNFVAQKATEAALAKIPDVVIDPKG